MGNRYELHPLVNEKGYKITLIFKDRTSATGYTIDDLNWKTQMHEESVYVNGDNRWGVKVRWINRKSGGWDDGFILPDGTTGGFGRQFSKEDIDRIDIKESSVFPIAF